MRKSITSIGIIGKGAFGTLAHSLVPDGITRHTFEPGDSQEQFLAVAHCDAILLAIPLSAYEEVLTRLKLHLHPTTLLIDVCSVKLKPAELIAGLLPEHKNVLLTHPLFGPETYRRNDAKPTLVICSNLTEQSKAIIGFCKNKLSMRIVAMTPGEHDKEMALVHALTFFIARGLRGLSLGQLTLETPSFTHIRQLAHLDQVHSQELFETIELGNPFAKEIRESFVAGLQGVHERLGNG